MFAQVSETDEEISLKTQTEQRMENDMIQVFLVLSQNIKNEILIPAQFVYKTTCA